MSEIDALQIWGQLADECGEAVGYYRGAGMKRDQVLERGSANFDQKCKPNDEREKSHYRTDYYVSRSGYMKMHIRHNMRALKHCFKNEIPLPLLFVDFGCGPMTSGLALAKILSKRTPDYKMKTAYVGVDASHNMVNKANDINQKYKLFAPENFKVMWATQFDSQQMLLSFSEPQIIVLCFSFVLAPGTLDVQVEDIVRKLAIDWREYVENHPQCKETRIIYLNPMDRSFHSNWHLFKKTILTPGTRGKFSYMSSKRYTRLAVKHLQNPLYYAMIHGKRK